MLAGIAHVGFTVGDIEAATEFYRSLFGYEPEVRRIYQAAYTAEQVGYPGAKLDIAIFKIPGSDVRLELIEYLNPRGTPVDIETKNAGTAHICLMTEDLQAVFDKMLSLGAEARSAAGVRIDSGPNEGRHVCYFRDPEGLTIEVLETASGPARGPDTDSHG